MSRVVVIGGGISGLAAAYYLKQYAAEKAVSIEIRLMERENRLGGTICTEYEDGFVIEGGPDCFLSEKPWAISMARDIGVENRIEGTDEENRGTFILSKGRLHPLPEGIMLMAPTRIMPMVTSRLFSWRGKLRMGLDLFIKPLEDDVEETLAEFVTRRLGREALEKIAEPLVAGVHAGSPESMSLRASFPRFKQLEDEHGSLIKGMITRRGGASQPAPARIMFMTFRNGLGEFIKAIRSRFERGAILTGSTVTELMKKSAGGWLIQTVDGEIIEANGVICATPSYVTANLLAGFDAELAEELRGIPYVSTATVSMAFETGTLPKLKGFGFVAPRTEKRKIMAATWSSRKFSNRAPEGHTLLRCFIGGAHQPDALNQDDDTLVKQSLTELRSIIGLKAEPINAWVFRWPYSMPQTLVGHEDRMRRIEERISYHPGLAIAGGAYYGLGIPDCIHVGQMAAEKMLEFLKFKYPDSNF